MRRVVQVGLVVALVLDAAYWSIWFADRDVLASSHRQAYYEFENAFPLADLWLGIACLGALVCLARRTPMAVFWLICAGSAGLYLFSMDLLYDLEHDIFTTGGGGGAFEGLIVGLTLAFSLLALRFGWTRRDELLAGRP